MVIRKWGKLVILLVLLLLIIWSVVEYREYFTGTTIRDFVARLGIWGPLMFIGLYIIATVLFLPGSALTITGGLLFGPVLGTLYNLTGAVIGATLAFLLARYLASDWVAQRTQGRLKQLISGVEQEDWKFVAVVRLIPLLPFNLLNYALGLTRISITAYVLASAVFMLPGTIAYTYLGSLGNSLLAGDLKEIISRAAIALSLLLIAAGLPWIVKQWRKSSDTQQKE